MQFFFGPNQTGLTRQFSVFLSRRKKNPMKQTRRRVRAKVALITLGAVAALATAIVAPAAPAFASSQTVAVNFASASYCSVVKSY